MRTVGMAVLAGIVGTTAPELSGAAEEGITTSRTDIVPDSTADKDWTPTEAWAWEQIRKGSEVTLPGPCPDWRTGEAHWLPSTDRGLYTLRGEFIRQILTQPPYRATAVRRPISIAGAHIAGNVDVEGGTSHARLVVRCSTVAGSVTFDDWDFRRRVEFLDIAASGSIRFYDVEASSRVTVMNGDVHHVEVVGSQIGGRLSLRNTRIREFLKIVSTQVGGSLLMGCPQSSPEHRRCASYGPTRFIHLATGGGVDLIGSRFRHTVTFENLDVAGDFLAREAEYEEGMTIAGGTIDGRFSMPGSRSTAPVSVTRITALGGMDLTAGHYGPVTIRDADVHRHLDLTGSTIRSLDITGTIVRGQLRIAPPPEESDRSDECCTGQFTARNARVESLQDTEGSWPRWPVRELEGFEYDKLDVPPGSMEQSPYLRNIQWFKRWLDGAESYSPQPYRHLSTLLRKEGQRSTANAILYEAKERQRMAVPWGDWDRVGLEFLCWTIGYGIGLKPLRALMWMAAFGIVGWFVSAGATRDGEPASRVDRVWYSAAHTIPGFALVKADELTMPRLGRSWFYVQRLICYAAALLAGAAAVGLVHP